MTSQAWGTTQSLSGYQGLASANYLEVLTL